MTVPFASKEKGGTVYAGFRKRGKSYDEQERRIKAFIREHGDGRKSKILKAWENHHEKEIVFPFAAEITDEPGPLEIGDVLKVTGIDSGLRVKDVEI